MTHTIDFPVHLYLLAINCMPTGGCIGTATRNLAPGNAVWLGEIRCVAPLCRKCIRFYPLLYGLVSIERSNKLIICTMKDDGWDETGMITHSIICIATLLNWLRSATPHHLEGCICACRGLIFQSRMYSDCRKDIRVGRSQDNSYCSTGGNSRDIYPCGINRPGHSSIYDCLNNTCNTGRLTASTHLICGEEPVPTHVLVGRFGLLRIDYNKIVLFCQQIHAGTCREI